MKKLLLNTLLLFGLLCIPVGCGNGCTSLNKATYRAVGASSITADHVKKAWDDYVAQGKATPADLERFGRVYKAYLTAELAVVDAAIAYKQTPTEDAAAKLRATLAAAGAALSDLVSLTKQFIPELK